MFTVNHQTNRIDYKPITGSSVSPDGNIYVQNAKRKEILDLLKNRKVEALNLSENRQLLGKLVSQRQNEEGFFENLYDRCKKRLRTLEKQHSKK